MSRPSPTESATTYDPYTAKKGNDNNIYINIPDRNNTPRWLKLANIIDEKPNFNMKLLDQIYREITKKPTVFEFLDNLKIDTILTMSDYTAVNTIKQFKRGTYYIYYYNENLIASKKKLSLNNFLNTAIRTTDEVDTRHLCFRDLAPILTYAKFATNTLTSKQIKFKKKPNSKFIKSYIHKPYISGNRIVATYIQDMFPLPNTPGVTKHKKLPVHTVTCQDLSLKYDQILNKYLSSKDLEALNDQFLTEVYDCNNKKTEPLIIYVDALYDNTHHIACLEANNDDYTIQLNTIYTYMISDIQTLVEEEESINLRDAVERWL